MMGGIGIALGNGSRNKGEAKDRKRRQTKAESKATNQVLTVENPPREPAEFCFFVVDGGGDVSSNEMPPYQKINTHTHAGTSRISP